MFLPINVVVFLEIAESSICFFYVICIFFSSQVAHMTKSEMNLHDLAFLGPGLLFLDQYFNSFIDEYLVLWIALVSTCSMSTGVFWTDLYIKAQMQSMTLMININVLG